jgi:hypothetical protein
MPALFATDAVSRASVRRKPDDPGDGPSSFFFSGFTSTSRKPGTLTPTVAYAVEFGDEVGGRSMHE